MQDTTSNGFEYVKQKCVVSLAKQRSVCVRMPTSVLEKAENSKYSILYGVIILVLERHDVPPAFSRSKTAWAATKQDQRFSTRPDPGETECTTFNQTPT